MLGYFYKAVAPCVASLLPVPLSLSLRFSLAIYIYIYIPLLFFLLLVLTSVSSFAETESCLTLPFRRYK